MSITPRAGGFQVSLYFPGVKRIRRLFRTENEAQTFVAEQKLTHLKGQPVAQPTATPAKAGGTPTTLRQLLNYVYDNHWCKAKSEDQIAINMRHVEEALGPDLPIRQIDATTVDTLKLKLAEMFNNGTGTVNRKLAILSFAMRFARDRGWVQAVPKITRYKERECRIRFLTDAEEKLVLQWFKQTGFEWMADLTVVLIDTGMRLSAALRMTAKEVDFKGKTVTVWDDKTSPPRTIPLTSRVLAVLKGRMTLDRFFPYNSWKCDKAWERMRASIHLSADDQFVIHALRHTCASRLVQRGVPLRVVQEWLGHKNIATTLRYAHLAPENLRAAVKVLENPPQEQISCADTKAHGVPNVA